MYLDGQKAVLYRSKMNPSLGRNFEAMDPLAWLARMADHTPTRANIAPTSMASTQAASGLSADDGNVGHPARAAPAKRRCSPGWARLISKVYPADPLVCKGCAGPLKIVAYIDELSIRRILDHLWA